MQNSNNINQKKKWKQVRPTRFIFRLNIYTARKVPNAPKVHQGLLTRTNLSVRLVDLALEKKKKKKKKKETRRENDQDCKGQPRTHDCPNLISGSCEDLRVCSSKKKKFLNAKQPMPHVTKTQQSRHGFCIQMGPVRITQWYITFNGSHFDWAGLGGSFVWTTVEFR